MNTCISSLLSMYFAEYFVFSLINEIHVYLQCISQYFVYFVSVPKYTYNTLQ